MKKLSTGIITYEIKKNGKTEIVVKTKDEKYKINWLAILLYTVCISFTVIFANFLLKIITNIFF
jgi:hypothetical protein